MQRNIALIGAASVIALVTGSLLYPALFPPSDPLAECRNGQVAGGDIGGAFTMTNQLGETVTDAEVITGPTLMYFGYTFCPDVCPLDVSRNAQAVSILEERGISVRPVFVSIDPDRDTPEVLASFTGNFHDQMVGLSGTPEQTAAIARAYKVYYQKQDGDDPDYYMMDHSTFSYFMTPELGFVDFFRRDESPEDMAERLACFIEKS